MEKPDHYINLSDLDEWEYIQYPCLIKNLRDFIDTMLFIWQKIAMSPADMIAANTAINYRKMFANRIVTEMINSIPEDENRYRFFMWMDNQGKIHFYHMDNGEVAGGIFRKEIETSFMSRRPGAVLQFNARLSLCNVCTLWPLSQDLAAGQLFPMTDGVRLYPDYLHMSTIVATDSNGLTVYSDGRYTLIPDIMGPVEYHTFYHWREEVGVVIEDYLYVYTNTNPAMIHFADWAMEMIMSQHKFDGMREDLMKTLKTEMQMRAQLKE